MQLKNISNLWYMPVFYQVTVCNICIYTLHSHLPFPWLVNVFVIIQQVSGNGGIFAVYGMIASMLSFVENFL